MKKLFIAALALVTSLAQAQKLDNALLWKISGNGLAKPSYLFGTMHITCDATLDKNVLTALDNTGRLFLELDMDDPNMQAEMMSGLMMKDGAKMSTLATPEDFKVVDEFLTKNVGMGAKMMDGMMPSVVEMMVMPKMMDCPMQSIEEELIKVTKQQKETVSGLEEVAEQMAVFASIPYKEQMDQLVLTAKEGLDKGKVKYARMNKLYMAKDLNGLMAFMNEDDNKMYGDNADVLLDNRNANWIPKIEKAAKEMPTFFGVGAAHLGGDKGVIMLLRKKGYKVEAVK
jgi:uncharacterized protein YbaP (TraB family)